MIALLAFAGLIFAPSEGQAGDQALPTFAEAQTQAQGRDSFLLVDFFADWCGPCKAFDRDRATSEPLQEALDSVVFTSIDAEKGEGIELAMIYEIESYPTYVLMNAEGEVIDRWAGYLNPEGFIESLHTALADPTTLAEKSARYERDPNAADAELLGRIAESRSAYAQALEYFRKAEELDPSWDLSSNIFWASYYEYLRGETVSADELKAAADRMVESSAKHAGSQVSVIVDLAMIMDRVAKRENRPELRAPYLEAALVAAVDDPDMHPANRTAIELLAALHLERDEARAVELKRQTMSAGWMEDAGELNSFAWWCFENELNVEDAERLARKGVELAEPGREKAMILDTVAELCNLRGDCRESVTLIESAIQEDPENDYYQEQLERFQKLLTASELTH